MFIEKAKSLGLSGTPLGAFATIRPGWKRLTVRNTLAFLGRKKCIQASGFFENLDHV
jgi:hypothetical protein